MKTVSEGTLQAAPTNRRIAMSETLVRYRNIGPAASITLNRPAKRNALSRDLIAQLDAAFTKAMDDETARVVVLGATGQSFCAGMDLAELKDSVDLPKDLSPVWHDALRLAKLYDRIYTLPKPTLALVQGPAIAGGAGLVTVCDLAIATEEAKFGYPEVRRGLVAAMVMPHLMRHVGERMARWLLLTGEMIDARAAHAAGLINEVVPEDKLAERTREIVFSLAEGGPEALAKTKELLGRFSRQALSIEAAAHASAEPRLTQECQSGLKAFSEKLPTPWAPKP
jgi:methylglutaconyl-CoA hydratase